MVALLFILKVERDLRKQNMTSVTHIVIKLILRLAFGVVNQRQFAANISTKNSTQIEVLPMLSVTN